MKFKLMTFLVLVSLTRAQLPLDQLEEESIVIQQELNSQQSSELLYEKPVITQTQELYSKPVITKQVISQPVITQRIVQQPIIKQRVVQTPVIRQTVVQRPVYTETENKEPIIDNQTQVVNVPVQVPGKTTIREKYIQPTIITKDVQLQINRSEPEIVNMPVQTRPTRYEEEVITKTVQAPAKEVYTQPIIQKQIINNKELVEFQKAEPIYENKEPIIRQPVLQERTRTQTVTRPGKEIINQTYVQPIIQRENVDVQFQQQPAKSVQMEPVQMDPTINTNVRTETVQVPANQIITQPVLQNFVEQREIHHVQTPVVKRVPVQRPFAVPTPVIKKVPVVRKIPVPVPSEKDRGTKIVNLTRLHLKMPEQRSSSSSSSESKQSVECGHSHYENGYSYNSPDMNKYGLKGCNGCPANYPGCAPNMMYHPPPAMPVPQVKVIRKRNYADHSRHGNSAFGY